MSVLKTTSLCIQYKYYLRCSTFAYSCCSSRPVIANDSFFELGKARPSSSTRPARCLLLYRTNGGIGGSQDRTTAWRKRTGEGSRGEHSAQTPGDVKPYNQLSCEEDARQNVPSHLLLQYKPAHEPFCPPGV